MQTKKLVFLDLLIDILHVPIISREFARKNNEIVVWTTALKSESGKQHISQKWMQASANGQFLKLNIKEYVFEQRRHGIWPFFCPNSPCLAVSPICFTLINRLLWPSKEEKKRGCGLANGDRIKHLLHSYHPAAQECAFLKLPILLKASIRASILLLNVQFTCWNL